MELKSRNAALRYEKKVEKNKKNKRGKRPDPLIGLSLMKKSINFSGFGFMDESFSWG